MKLNEEEKADIWFFQGLKLKYEVATRLSLNSNTLDRVEESKLVGFWITTWLDLDKNTREICKKAYA